MSPDLAVEVRLRSLTMENRLPRVGKAMAGERVLIRVSYIGCLYQDHKQLRTVDGLVLDVFEEDWVKLEKAFRYCFLGGEVKAK